MENTENTLSEVDVVGKVYALIFEGPRKRTAVNQLAIDGTAV